MVKNYACNVVNNNNIIYLLELCRGHSTYEKSYDWI